MGRKTTGHLPRAGARHKRPGSFHGDPVLGGAKSEAGEEPREMPLGNKKQHRTGRTGWLRAAVLGANDGILSTSSLVLGVAAAHATRNNLLVAGIAGLVAGAMSMAAG